MSRRTSILERLRRLKNGAARQVVAVFALAYLAAGVAPCATAATQAAGDSVGIERAVGTHSEAEHGHHAHHAEHAQAAPDRHGTADGVPPPHHGDRHCPHCPAGAAVAQAENHFTCFALDDLTNVAASQAKDVSQALAPWFVVAPFTLPPPLASPIPPPRTAAIAPVPLNVRLCVFLI